jgi:PTH1 family peptidyl-tRNA hydrolase
MKIIIGLGNPGKKYENTRHNVGFLSIEYIRKHSEWSEWEDSKFHALTARINSATLIKPLTFMNLSWDAVLSIVQFYKLDPKKDILVISDDIDMEFWKVRFREKWSHGGQNGLKDIISKLGTDEFSRIKIGIGRHEKFEVVDWVLSKFQKDEIENLEVEVFPKIEEIVNKWLWDSI